MSPLLRRDRTGAYRSPDGRWVVRRLVYRTGGCCWGVYRGGKPLGTVRTLAEARAFVKSSLGEGNEVHDAGADEPVPG